MPYAGTDEDLGGSRSYSRSSTASFDTAVLPLLPHMKACSLRAGLGLSHETTTVGSKDDKTTDLSDPLPAHPRKKNALHTHPRSSASFMATLCAYRACVLVPFGSSRRLCVGSSGCLRLDGDTARGGSDGRGGFVRAQPMKTFRRIGAV